MICNLGDPMSLRHPVAEPHIDICDEYVCKLMVYMNIHAMYDCIPVSKSQIHIHVTYEFIFEFVCDMSRAHIYDAYEFIRDM